MAIVFLTANSGTWLVPAGVTSVQIECIGGGSAGNGAGRGGRGGYYVKKTALTVTPGNSITYQVGKGQSPGVSSPPYDTWFSSAATVFAQSGNSGTTNISIGDTIYSGGGPGTADTLNGNTLGGGGGGAGGPNGAGNAGSNGNISTGAGGTGGRGGNASGGVGGATNTTGANGTEFDATHGSGGGGGGSGGTTSIYADVPGSGGNYGAGGGGGGADSGGGSGTQGLIVLTYSIGGGYAARMAGNLDGNLTGNFS
jgi:hypothetical protein